MVAYKYLLVDASTGGNLGTLPLDVSSFSRVLNGVGQLSATLPLDHPLAASLDGDREITVMRGDGTPVAWSPVWNGPIDTLDPDDETRVVQITAREASWYMSKRTLEINKNYNADVFYIGRSLINYMVTKTGSGGANINAALPRFTTAPASGSSGITKAVRYYGSARHLISDIIDDLVADPNNPFEYKMDYSTGSGWVTCQRTLTFGAPLGTARTQRLTEHNLTPFTKSMDRARAATRVHVLGAGYTSTQQNTGSVTAGEILIEAVFDRTDKANHTFIDNYAKNARYLSQPPVSAYGATFVPTKGGLEFGFCDLGDTVNLQYGGATLLASSGTRRVMEIAVRPPPAAGGVETVALTLNVPLDQLGT